MCALCLCGSTSPGLKLGRPGVNSTNLDALLVLSVANNCLFHRTAHHPSGVSFLSNTFLCLQISPMAQNKDQRGAGHSVYLSAPICGFISFSVCDKRAPFSCCHGVCKSRLCLNRDTIYLSVMDQESNGLSTPRTTETALYSAQINGDCPCL